MYASLMGMTVSVFCSCTFISMHDSYKHIHARAHESCGGDECDADSPSLLRQSYTQTCTHVCMCVYMHIFV
jgi:hypothetical protein